MTEIEWNAETEQWEANGKRFQGEILWCTGWHDGLNIHDPWWCLWRTVQELNKLIRSR